MKATSCIFPGLTTWGQVTITVTLTTSPVTGGLPYVMESTVQVRVNPEGLSLPLLGGYELFLSSSTFCWARARPREAFPPYTTLVYPVGNMLAMAKKATDIRAAAIRTSTRLKPLGATFAGLKPLAMAGPFLMPHFGFT